MTWIGCKCCRKRSNWTDFDAPELRCAFSEGVDWRKPEPQKPARAKWEGTLRFIRRAEQCNRMIAAHKASTWRKEQWECLRNFDRDSLATWLAAYRKVSNGRRHVRAAMRFLGVRL